MLGRVVKHDTVVRIAQKGRPCLQIVQDPALAELAQVDFKAISLGYPAHQTLRDMDVEIVTDEMPAHGQRIGGHRALGMTQKIGFRAGRATGRRNHLAAGDIEVEQKGSRSVTNILKLATGDLARSQR